MISTKSTLLLTLLLSGCASHAPFHIGETCTRWIAPEKVTYSPAMLGNVLVMIPDVDPVCEKWIPKEKKLPEQSPH